MATKKLTRSTNKILAGVCGGIAEYFDIDPTLVRILYAALTFFSAAFPGLILYIIMMLIMPEKDKNDNIPDAEVVE
jgi:phage shock protein PspC (stress-responsive transcriptional regulator)